MILAHIAGPSGAGKTELARSLQQHIPEWRFIDLDDLDDQAIHQLGLPQAKLHYTEAMLQALFDQKQRLVLQVAKGIRPVVLVGHHTENERILQLPDVHYRFLLINDFRKGLTRRYRKGQYTAQDIRQLVQQGRDDIHMLTTLGYTPMSPRAVYTQLLQLAQSQRG